MQPFLSQLTKENQKKLNKRNMISPPCFQDFLCIYLQQPVSFCQYLSDTTSLTDQSWFQTDPGFFSH